MWWVWGTCLDAVEDVGEDGQELLERRLGIPNLGSHGSQKVETSSDSTGHGLYAISCMCMGYL